MFEESASRMIGIAGGRLQANRNHPTSRRADGSSNVTIESSLWDSTTLVTEEAPELAEVDDLPSDRVRQRAPRSDKPRQLLRVSHRKKYCGKRVGDDLAKHLARTPCGLRTTAS